jgi:hypothetical protein
LVSYQEYIRNQKMPIKYLDYLPPPPSPQPPNSRGWPVVVVKEKFCSMVM